MPLWARIFLSLSKSSRSLLSKLEEVSWLNLPSTQSFCLLRNQSGILYCLGLAIIVIIFSTYNQKVQNMIKVVSERALNVSHVQAYITSVFQLTSSSEHSPARLSKSTSAFLRTILAYLRPTPLIAVMANITFLFPSMFVPKIRRICWNFSGMTSD